MINPYSSIINYEEDDWQEYLNKICLVDIFKELIIKHGADKSLLKSYIKYIVWSYSKESDMVILGNDWQQNKRRIFDAAGFKPIEELLNSTVYLHDDVVLRTIQKWMSFQDDATYTQLNVLKDLMVEMQISANSKILKSSGEIDYDQKYKNACYVKDLRNLIKDLESELIQSSPKLKEGYKEVKQSVNKRNTRSTEEIFTAND